MIGNLIAYRARAGLTQQLKLSEDKQRVILDLTKVSPSELEGPPPTMLAPDEPVSPLQGPRGEIEKSIWKAITI
jgi:hypothetical protein